MAQVELDSSWLDRLPIVWKRKVNNLIKKDRNAAVKLFFETYRQGNTDKRLIYAQIQLLPDSLEKILKEIKELTGAKVLVHEADKKFLTKGTSAPVKPLTFLVKLLMSSMPKSWYVFLPIEPDIVISEDYSLEEFGVNAKVLHTPGHTDGTLSITT